MLIQTFFELFIDFFLSLIEANLETCLMLKKEQSGKAAIVHQTFVIN